MSEISVNPWSFFTIIFFIMISIKMMSWTKTVFIVFTIFFVFIVFVKFSISFFRFRRWNWNRNSSDDRNLLCKGNRLRSNSSERNFFKNWILNMMNIVSLIIFLDNRLSDNLLSWNFNSLLSNNIANFWSILKIMKLNLLLWSSNNF